VKTDQIVRHAKVLEFVNHKNMNGSISAFTLVADWYALSLSNVMFAWRRDTKMLSTFAQVSFLIFLFRSLIPSLIPAFLFSVYL
jgi:hypothetical protein